MSDLSEALATAAFHVTSPNGGEFTFRADFAALFKQLEKQVKLTLKSMRRRPSESYLWAQAPDYVRDPHAVRDPTAVGWRIPGTELLLGTTGVLYQISAGDKVLGPERPLNLRIEELQALVAGLSSMTTKN